MKWSLLLLLIAGCTRSCADPEPTETGSIEPVTERNVVVLVLDGLRFDESFGDGYSSAADMSTADMLPQLRSELLPQGTLIKPGYATGITITAPGHSDMITGARQVFGNYPNGDGVGAYRPELPTLFEELRAQAGLERSAALLGTNTPLVTPVSHSMYPGNAGLGAEEIYYFREESAISDPETLLELREDLEALRPRLTFVNLHGIDRAGHYEGIEAYPDQALAFDGVLSGFWEWLQGVEGYGPSTVLVLTADHGRHRLGEEEDWRSHGDHCAGCRELPMFLVGPGVAAGVVIEEPYSLVDLTQTLGWLLDVSLPYGEGVLITEALSDPPADDVVRDGLVLPTLSGARLAAQRWEQGLPRATVEVDGVTLSSDDAFSAEAPRLLETSLGAVACWRELELVVGADEMPWLGRCFLDDGSDWLDMGFPQIPVSPLWAPDLLEGEDGTLWMAMVANSTGVVGDEGFTSARIWILRYDPVAMEWAPVSQADNSGEGLIFPTHARITAQDDQLFVAYGTSSGGDSGRKSRRIDVVAQSPAGFGPWLPLLSIGPGSAPDGVLDLTVSSSDRLERPALRSVGGDLLLGAVSYTESGDISVVATRSSDGGRSWDDPIQLDALGRVFPHIDPRWTEGGELLWAERSESDAVAVCRSTLGGERDCVETEAAYIMGLDAQAGEVVASLRAEGEVSWELVTISWPTR